MLPPEPHLRSSYVSAFAAALIDPGRETPAVVAGPNGKAVVKRYNVYRNNVTSSLIDALAAIYPAVQRITGVEFFRAMARFHIRATPPTSPLLFEYGRDFPAFIEQYEYAGAMPWLARRHSRPIPVWRCRPVAGQGDRDTVTRAVRGADGDPAKRGTDKRGCPGVWAYATVRCRLKWPGAG